MQWQGGLRKLIWYFLAADLLLVAAALFLSESLRPLAPPFVAAAPPILYFSWMLGVQKPDVKILPVSYRKYPRRVWRRGGDEGIEEVRRFANAVYAIVGVQHVGLKTAKDCAVLAKLDGPSGSYRLKGRWSLADNPQSMDLHPGDVEECTLFVVRLDDKAVELPLSFSLLEQHQRAQGEIPPGAWVSQRIPAGQYAVRIRVVASDYKTPWKRLGDLRLPDDVLKNAPWATDIARLREDGFYLEWGKSELEPTDADVKKTIQDRDADLLRRGIVP